MTQALRIIRLTTTEELEKLANNFAPSPYNKPATVFTEYFLEYQKGLREIYLAVLEGSIIGYITLVWDSPYFSFSEAKIPEIKDLNILEEHRRCGYGTKLINHLEQRVRGKGYPVIGIGVGVTSDYEAAKNLYSSIGYLPDSHGVQSDEWGGTIYLTKVFGKS